MVIVGVFLSRLVFYPIPRILLHSSVIQFFMRHVVEKVLIVILRTRIHVSIKIKQDYKVFQSHSCAEKNIIRWSPDSTNFVTPDNCTIAKAVLSGD